MRYRRLGLAALSFWLIHGTARAQPEKPGYSLTFQDEFGGAAVDSTRWQKRYKWGEAQINGELQAYVDDAFQFDGAILGIVGTHSPGQYAGLSFDYRSGLIASVFHQRYGWFEIRCKMPLGQGLWPAFWLLGETGTQGVNEIDIHEYLGDDPTTVYMGVHWGQSYSVGHQSAGTSYVGADFSADFHTFAVDWEADHVIWYVDGVERFRHTGDGVPQVEMYIIANLAIGGTWPGAPDSTTVFPTTYAIDYVRAYAKVPGDAGAGGSGGTNNSKQGGSAGNAGGAAGGTPEEACGCRVAAHGSKHFFVAWAALALVVGRRARRKKTPG